MPFSGGLSIRRGLALTSLGRNSIFYDAARDIFDNGEIEAFLGSTEIYTISTGITLAEAGDSWGLMVDGRYRLERGEDIGPATPFSSGFGAINGTLSYPDGVATATASSDGQSTRLEYAAAVVSGQFYEVLARVATTRAAGGAGNNITAWTGVVESPSLTISSGSGTFVDVRVVVQANSASLLMRFYLASGQFAENVIGDKIEISSLSIRPLPGNHRLQSNSALRPAVGRQPVDVRNLLVETENLAGSAWSKGGTSSIPSQTEIAPDGSATAMKVQFGLGGADRITQTVPSTTGDIATGIWLRADAARELRVGNGAGVNAFGTVSITTEWQFFELTDDVTPNTFFSLYNSGVPSDIPLYVWHPRLEVGTETTNYQRVGASNLDITEEGVPSYTIVRHNGVDQKTQITIQADITNGTIIWGGRKGTWVHEGWSRVAGVMEVGPTSIPGLPDGVLFAIGDEVEDGLVIADYAMTEAEINREIALLKAKGAKGRLVEGPELVTNGTFDTDLSGWSDVSNGTALVEWVSGKASFDDTQGGDGIGKPKLSQSLSGAPPVIVRFVTENDATFTVQNETDVFSAVTSSGLSRALVVAGSSATWVFSLQIENPATIRTVDNVSVRRLIPEEDL